MRILKISAIAALALTTLFAMSSFAVACDKTAKTETASAETAAVKTAGAACSSSAETASVKTAGAAGCASGATASVAGAGCTKGADAATAGTKVAGATCSSSKTASMPADLAVEAVRMPSGALAVFYTGTSEATVAGIHAKAAKGAAGFGCDLAGSMAGNESCNVEVVNIKNGVMMLVSSEKADILDQYQKQYEVATASPTRTEGE